MKSYNDSQRLLLPRRARQSALSALHGTKPRWCLAWGPKDGGSSRHVTLSMYRFA